jgi:hypothetical protein
MGDKLGDHSREPVRVLGVPLSAEVSEHCPKESGGRSGDDGIDKKLVGRATGLRSGTMIGQDPLEARIEAGRRMLTSLIQAEALPMKTVTPSEIPQLRGIYCFDHLDQNEADVVRAGRASSGGGLRQRIYVNNLMGNQPGNLRAQLVAAGDVVDLVEAKEWIRNRLQVRFLVLPVDEIVWSENFMLSILRPRFSD